MKMYLWCEHIEGPYVLPAMWQKAFYRIPKGILQNVWSLGAMYEIYEN